VFVSSGNVYADFSRLEQPESGALLPPLESEVMDDMSTYGEAKVACEDAVRTSGATATIVRSGLIAGPGDWSGRSGYYPWRFANPTGSDVLVPDDLEFPCAMIDVRDLAAWLVSSARERFDGTYNATGPTSPLKQVLSAAALAAESNTKLRPVPVATLSELGVSAWMGPKSLPLWIDDPDWRYFATLDTSAARSAGLQTRPLLETLRDTLVFENQRTEPRQTGLTDDEERSLRSQLGQ
jgi:nucleoside-diphosphate-sugar epimerase